MPSRGSVVDACDAKNDSTPRRMIIASFDRQSLTNVIGGEIATGRSLDLIKDDLVEQGVEADMAADLVASIAEYSGRRAASWEKVQRAEMSRRRGLVYFATGMLLAAIAIGIAGGAGGAGAIAIKLLILVVPYGAIQFWRGSRLLRAAMDEHKSITDAWLRE